MSKTQVKKVPRKAKEKEAQAETKTETKPTKDLVDDIDQMLKEIDEVLEEVAGGKSSEQAMTFVSGYIQKGGQ